MSLAGYASFAITDLIGRLYQIAATSTNRNTYTFNGGVYMSGSIAEKDIGTKVMDLLIMLLEDQTGQSYEYKKVEAEEETA